MRFTVVILSAFLCLNAFAQTGKTETSDEDIVAAAEKLVSESQDESAAAKIEAVALEAKKESEIPVFTKSEKVAKSESSLLWRLLGSIAFIATIGGGLIFAGKRWKRVGNKGGEKARIEVLHQYHLGPKKSVALIRVAGEAILIGCTDQSVNLIKSIALIDDELDGGLGGKDFNGFLEDEFSMEDMRSALQPRV